MSSSLSSSSSTTTTTTATALRSALWLLVLCAVAAVPLLAFGQEVPLSVPTTATTPAAQGFVPGMDPAQYLLGLGPIGALVYGAYLLGKGVKISVQIDLPEETQNLLRRGVIALEEGARRGAMYAQVMRGGGLEGLESVDEEHSGVTGPVTRGPAPEAA